jgi:DNA-binding response OmpR family regulator
MTLPLQGHWILIAEDEALIALDLRTEFEAAGAHVATAFSLGQAMTLLDGHHWAGAVLDFALCDEDCTPLCEWFLERQIPFIICSGYEEVSAPCSRGIRMVKPVVAEELVNSMAALLAAHPLGHSQIQ